MTWQSKLVLDCSSVRTLVAATAETVEKVEREWQVLPSRAMAATNDAKDDNETVAALDTQYQEAVKHNDAATMDRILADDFIVITSSGKTYNKAELLDEARSGRILYEHHKDTEKTVRRWRDTAIVSAKLWEKGTENGKTFEHKLWFSDVYRRTLSGWRYVFAQSAYRPCESIT